MIKLKLRYNTLEKLLIGKKWFLLFLLVGLNLGLINSSNIFNTIPTEASSPTWPSSWTPIVVDPDEGVATGVEILKAEYAVDATHHFFRITTQASFAVGSTIGVLVNDGASDNTWDAAIATYWSTTWSGRSYNWSGSQWTNYEINAAHIRLNSGIFGVELAAEKSLIPTNFDSNDYIKIVSTNNYPRPFDNSGYWLNQQNPTNSVDDQTAPTIIDSTTPSLSAGTHSPASPTDQNNVTFSVNVTDNVVVQAATLYYSTNGGSSWQTSAMSGGLSYNATIGPFSAYTTVWYYFNASDLAGNTQTDPTGAPANYYSFVVADIDPPIIKLLSPKVNQSGITLGENITLEIIDNVSVDTVLYNWDNGPNQTALNGENYTITVPTDYGAHILRVYANDTSNNWNTSKYLFTVGSVLSGKISDTLIGTPIPSASILLINDTTGGLIDSMMTNTTGHYRFTGLAVGQYGINVSAIGFYPNSASGVIVVVGVETIQDFDLIEAEKPVFTSISPANNSLIPQNTQITVNITDNYGLYQIHHYWDNESTNTSLVVYGNSTYSYIVTNLPNTLGIHILHVFVEDIGISVGYSKYLFNVSEVAIVMDPPEIIVNGIENATTYSETVLISVTITHNQPLSSIILWADLEEIRKLVFYLDNNLTLTNVSSTSWTFSISLDTNKLINGDYSVGIEVIDSHGISNEVTFFISIENLATSSPDIPLTTSSTDIPSSSAGISTIPTTITGFAYVILVFLMVFTGIKKRYMKKTGK
ncbi:MAG: carboxypeptidase-like regulatory domain-containing protein [Candidatus Hodarchaeales archaeon]